MEKLSTPKLEVIHFNTEDVIVTSSKYSSLDPKLSYFTWGSEINDFTKSSDRSNDRYSIFNYDSSTGTLNLLQKDVGPEVTLKKQQDFYYPYAWYDGGWFTESQSRDHYKTDQGNYKWRYSN